MITLLLLAGCDNNMSTLPEKSETKFHTEIGVLNKLISLPKDPITVKWKVNESRGSETGSLRALLKFKEEDQASIVNDSLSFDKEINDTVSAEIYEGWLTADAKAGLEATKEGERYTLNGVFSLQPDLFTKTELSPYVNGSITPLSGGYILVSLYSM